LAYSEVTFAAVRFWQDAFHQEIYGPESFHSIFHSCGCWHRAVDLLGLDAEQKQFFDEWIAKEEEGWWLQTILQEKAATRKQT
jgi:hypothetical protein